MEFQKDGTSLCSETPACIHTISIDALKKGGRTPLHVACQRDRDYLVSARTGIKIKLIKVL